MRVVEKGVVYDKSSALIAGVCRCTGGDLLVSFDSRGDLSAGEKAFLVRSHDDGRTWSEPEATFESVFVEGGIEIGCSISCLPDGRLLLPYTDGFYLHPKTDNYNRRTLLFCLTSDDEGRSWSNRRAQAFEGIEAFAYGKVVSLPDGTILMPLWGAYDVYGKWYPGVLKSRDRGATWGDYRRIADAGSETPIVVLPDGRILALLRGYTAEPNRPLYVSYSDDGGDTWSLPGKTTVDGTAPSLHISPKGTLLAGYRSNEKGGVCRVAASEDSGTTWELALELDLPHDAWDKGGYPVFENLPNGEMFVSFHNAVPTWYVAYNIIRE